VTRRRIVGLLASSLVVWLAVWRPWGWYYNDLGVYRAGGSALLHGRDVYGFRVSSSSLGFTYPPFAAVVFVPLAVVPFAAAKWLMTLASFALLGFVIVRAVRSLPDTRAAALRPWLPGIAAIAVWLGQINVVVMALVIADVLPRVDRRTAGLGVGAAAALKLTPLAFVPYLLLIGRRRQAAVAVGSFAGFTLLASAVDPAASHRYWIGRLFLDAHRVGRVENASNQSVRGVIARALSTTTVPGWWIVIAAAVFALGLWAAVALHRRGEQLQSVSVMALTMLCVSPISWSHHWVWAALALVCCADLVARDRRPSMVLASVVFVVPLLLGLVFYAPHRAHLELTDAWWQQLLSAAYVAVAFGFAGLVMFTGRSPGMAHPASNSLVELVERA
jgi:alpha-1,2-mannosyltransferase